MTDTTPAEFVKLRDQLARDLGAIIGDRARERRVSEYLLASGLVPLSTIRARYDETHPAPESERAEIKTWERGEGIEVGALVEYVGGYGVDHPERIGKRGTVTYVSGASAGIEGLPGNSRYENLRRIR